MKALKIFLLSAALFAGTLTIRGQEIAVVNFNNNVAFSTAADRNVYFGDVGGPLLIGTKFKAQLYVGTNPELLEPIISAPASFRAQTGAGTWMGGSRQLVTATTTHYDRHTFALAVRVWDITTGDSYETATVRGSSPVFSYTSYLGGGFPGCCYMEGLRAFAVAPEPGSLALGLLALGGIWFCKRNIASL